jgi:hypothetical protein
VPGEITALKHEVRDHTVETGACIAEAVLASRELSEISCGSGDFVVKQLENDSTSRLTVDGDVELHGKKQRENKINASEKKRGCHAGTGHVRRRWT